MAVPSAGSGSSFPTARSTTCRSPRCAARARRRTPSWSCTTTSRLRRPRGCCGAPAQSAGTAGRGMLLVADPVYQADDPRLTAPHKVAAVTAVARVSGARPARVLTAAIHGGRGAGHRGTVSGGAGAGAFRVRMPRASECYRSTGRSTVTSTWRRTASWMRRCRSCRRSFSGPTIRRVRSRSLRTRLGPGAGIAERGRRRFQRLRHRARSADTERGPHGPGHHDAGARVRARCSLHFGPSPMRWARR